ncbi:hypothetical protein PICMEDRAFT_71940 [Pichia membranifaciens NRRL Y-2026]|uniref:PH domain-containing protein n=1 Tax=Pichia membranifaciens NRRL Y-2026 TaxID=763406 RepID=A0A1E3NQT7_9ASCO|nr:hypothetical protein PICMEDRAFT_71940 [Pichia membranifaciens NRRL Y-2026]ODQ47933.1 hypothetical protein PICMEDRAFT_71940 [Pichia membranifaciens NRRL Y-2026]
MSQFSGNNSDIQDWDERPLSPVNITLGTNSSADLKSQLSQLQQKLNLNSIRPVRPSPNTEPEIHLPPLATLSSSQSNSLGNSTRTPDKSVDFLGDLSDGLLMESRKLSYENKQFKKQVSKLSAENESMKKQISNLNLLNKQLSEKEEQSNDKIWNLESELGNFKKSLDKTKSDLAKVKSDNTASISLIEQLKNSIENLTNERQSLLETSSLTISKLNSELSELKESNENLNDENDILHKNILDLKSEINVMKSEIAGSNTQSERLAESSFSEFDDSIVQDPLPAVLTEDLSKLDTDTLQKNLKLSYRQLLKLKSQNTRFKSELLKLKHGSPSPNKVQLLPKSLNDENDVENSWGYFEDDSFAKQPKKSNIVSSLIRSINEDDENEEDGDDDTNSFLADVSQLDGSSPVSTRKSSVSKPKESYILIVPKTTLDLNNNAINLKKIDLSEFQTIQVPDPIATELLASSSNKEISKSQFYNDEMLQLVSSHELSSLKSSIEEPSIDYVKSKALYHDHVSIPVKEHENLLSSTKQSAERIFELENLCRNQNNSLSSIKKQLEQTSTELTSKFGAFNSLKSEHENPSLEYINSKLPLHNLVSMDSQSHVEIKQRLEILQDKIKQSSENLDSLREIIEHLKNDKSNLEAQLRSPDIQYMKDKSTVMHYVFIPESEHIALKSDMTITEAKLKKKESEIRDLVDEKAKFEGKIADLEKIVTELKNSCSEFESKVLKLEEFQECPNSEYLRTKLSTHGLLALPVEEHIKLKTDNSLYNERIIKLTAENEAAKDENRRLWSDANERENKLKSVENKLDTVLKDFETIKQEKEQPGVEYIKSKASLYNLAVIPLEEHQSLKKEISTKDAKLADYAKLRLELDSKHDEIQQLINSKEKLNQLVKNTIASLKKRDSELTSLKQQLESPSYDYIKERSEAHGLAAITKEEHEKLKSELLESSELLAKKESEYASLQKIKDDLQREGTKSVSLDLHQSVQSELDYTKHDLNEYKRQVNNLKQVEIALKGKESELVAMGKKVSELETKAAQIDELNFELQNLRNAEEDLNKKQNELEGIKTERDEMQEKITSLQSKETQLLETLKNFECQNSELKSFHEKPDLDYIKEKSKFLGFLPVTLEEHTMFQSNLKKLEERNKKNVELEDNIVSLSTKNNELTELNNTLQKTVQELTEIKNKLQNPDIDFIKEKSSNLGLVSIPLSDHHNLKTKSETLASNIDALRSKISVVESEKAELNEKIKSLELMNASPSIEYIQSKSASLGIIPIPIAEHNSLKSELERNDILSKERDSQMKELNLLRKDITERKTQLRNAILQLNKISSSFEAPTMDYLKEKLKPFKYVAVSEADFESLKKSHEISVQQNENLEKKLVAANAEQTEKDNTISQLNRISSSYQAPAFEYLKEKLKALSYVAVPEADLETLEKSQEISVQKIEILERKLAVTETEILEKDNTISNLNKYALCYESPTVEYLKEKLKSFEYIALPESDLNGLKTLQNSSIEQIDNLKKKLAATNADLTEKDKQLEKLSVQLKAMINRDQSKNTNSKVVAAALPTRSSSFNIEGAQKGIEMNKTSSVVTVTSANVNDALSESIESIISRIEQNGYTVLTMEEYENLLKRGNNDADLDNLADITHEIEDIESDLESKKQELETKSRSSTISSSSSITSVSVENILSQKYSKLYDLINDLSIEVKNLKQEKARIVKQINRLSVSTNTLSNQKLNSTLSKKISRISDKIEIKEIEMKSQQSAIVAVKAYLEQSRGMDLPPVTAVTAEGDSDKDRSELEKEIALLQSKYDEKKQKMEKLVKEINNTDEPSQLVERLSLLGYTFTSPSGNTTMIREISINDNVIYLPAIIQSGSFDPSSGKLSVDKLAQENGFALISAAEAKQKQNIFDITDLSINDLGARAKELKHTLISDQKLKLIVAKSNEPKLPESLTLEELEPFAKKLGLRIISNEDIARLKARNITTRELASKAEELNLVLLSQDEVNDLNTHEPITEKNIVKKGKELGYLCIPSSQFVATTVSRTADIPNVTVLPNSYYKILTKSHEWYKKNKDKLDQSPAKQPQTIPEDDSFDLPSIMPNATPSGHQLPVSNIDTVSLHTVDTVISNKKLIIAAVTQTIIGEYLYKYYRKLGPFTSVSDTRHERFFWVHPYSMTLYWSPANPVVSDPARNQIKAMSILDVQCVNDNNPLPPGIHYKSIIIKSHNKSIKITCPTRQIHNIWYNSLKYLLERSMDSWVNDDDLEDQYQHDFTLDSKTKLERTQSQKFRRSHLSASDNRLTSKSTSLRSMTGSRR